MKREGIAAEDPRHCAPAIDRGICFSKEIALVRITAVHPRSRRATRLAGASNIEEAVGEREIRLSSIEASRGGATYHAGCERVGNLACQHISTDAADRAAGD